LSARNAKVSGSFGIYKVPSITETLKLLRGVGKTRPLGRRVVCLGGSCGLFAGALLVFRFFLVFLSALLGFFCGLSFGYYFSFQVLSLGLFVGFLIGFFRVLLCIFPMYVEASYAFISIKFYL
jgi:hypothetical protein